MKHLSDIGKNLALLTQLGLSLIMPLLLCLGGCYFLTSRLGIGGWIYIPGFFFGLGGSATTGYKFYKMIMKDEKANDRKDRVSFNRHG